MNTRYSRSTGAFYPMDIDYGDNLPPDVIEVPLSDYESAMARPAGHTFAFVDGHLVINAPPPVQFAEQAAPYMASVRITREAILNRLAGIGMAALIDGDGATCDCIVNARQALLDITKLPDVVAANDLEELKEAVKAAYKAIAAGVPAPIRSAFNMVDA
jgi:hypothetical protein